MNRGLLHTIALFCLLLLATGCSNFQKLLKSTDVSKKYQAALEYYEQEEYYRSSQLFDQVTDLMAGTEEGEKAQFYRAKAHFMQGNYILSEAYFRTFHTTYPRSPLAEEALFMQAQSLYEQSPSYQEDQTPTLTAIEAYEEFLVRYPTSERIAEANRVIEELYQKLDRKAFNQARLYYQLRYWRSAAVALNNFQKEHASSPYSEEAAFLKLDAQYRFALESVPAKQEERFDQAVDYFQSFVDMYPESQYRREAERVFDAVQSALATLRKSSANNQNS
ncbi:outer membrane protein assembly factor BamD [Pontibacter akesuensis]|uniref:Beta-barrel assembly machine subunit BamD n=1 Tax=Pontibacter akesuensis TaxID=388950 RepID=A0A1I7K1E1_9BACT|nr:outer membrane protein assembly factor BamD [Pontibacter akesuensis]GHA75809.1 outer membrane protein assembly factor BamD [Pontibacter akesuensis]SFU91273.1 Beta-barrel assembly machine subunit BamD [Pontibacter akesuensis]